MVVEIYEREKEKVCLVFRPKAVGHTGGVSGDTQRLIVPSG